MSEFADAKRHFYADAVSMGIGSPADLPRAFPAGSAVPMRLQERWLRNLHSTKGCPPPIDQFGTRLMNHFTLGADPEFVFFDASGRIDAATLQFKTGMAFGADLNGRLAEIRPYPSRSAFMVTASTLETLRWMSIFNDKARTYGWRAGAWAFRDGLGGHVHLGRKVNPVYKIKLSPEVKAMDVVCEAMLALGCFPSEENMARRGGDAHQQHYGLPSDIRPQAHGYEYRSYPSWLDSPWTAFLTLTLSKLATLDPSLLVDCKLPSVRAISLMLYNLLAYYKGRDDDAALAFHVVKMRGFPQADITDFRVRWGAKYPTKLVLPQPIQVIPPAIKPSGLAIAELYDYFVENKPLHQAVIPTPTWTPTVYPKGYYACLSNIDTARQVGLGEILWDTVASTTIPVSIMSGEGNAFLVSRGLLKFLPKQWRKRLLDIVPTLNIRETSDNALYIRLGLALRQAAQVQTTRRLLYSGVFPLWKLWSLQPNAFEQWRDTNAPPITVTKTKNTKSEIMLIDMFRER